MTQTGGNAKSDLDDSIIAQLIESSLHVRYSKDVEGGWWSRAQIREELLKRGWTLPPYTHPHDPNDNLEAQ
jgi:hypothetical protein